MILSIRSGRIFDWDIVLFFEMRGISEQLIEGNIRRQD